MYVHVYGRCKETRCASLVLVYWYPAMLQVCIWYFMLSLKSTCNIYQTSLPAKKTSVVLHTKMCSLRLSCVVNLKRINWHWRRITDGESKTN